MGQIQRGFFLCKLYEWMIRNVFVVFFPFARYLLMLEFGISSFIALRKIPCQKTIRNSNQRSFFWTHGPGSIPTLGYSELSHKESIFKYALKEVPLLWVISVKFPRPT